MTEQGLPGWQELTTGRERGPEEVQAAVNEALGIPARRVRYRPPEDSATAQQLGEPGLA